MVWAATGVAIGSAVLGAGSAIAGNKKAAAAAKKQAKLTYMQRMEEIRRSKRDQSRQLGYNKAAVAASDLTMSGSSKRALMDMQNSFSQENQWRLKSARMEKRAVEAGAPGSAADFGAVAQAGSSIASTIMVARG